MPTLKFEGLETAYNEYFEVKRQLETLQSAYIKDNTKIDEALNRKASTGQALLREASASLGHFINKSVFKTTSDEYRKKFGYVEAPNEDDEPDQTAVSIFSFICDEISKREIGGDITKQPTTGVNLKNFLTTLLQLQPGIYEKAWFPGVFAKLFQNDIKNNSSIPRIDVINYMWNTRKASRNYFQTEARKSQKVANSFLLLDNALTLIENSLKEPAKEESFSKNSSTSSLSSNGTTQEPSSYEDLLSRLDEGFDETNRLMQGLDALAQSSPAPLQAETSPKKSGWGFGFSKKSPVKRGELTQEQQDCIKFCNDFATEVPTTNSKTNERVFKPLDKAKLLSLVKLLAKKEVYKSSEDDVGTAFNSLLRNRLDIIKAFVEDPTFFYWLSVKKTSGGFATTSERDFRIGKVFQAFYGAYQDNKDARTESIGTLNRNIDSIPENQTEEPTKEQCIRAKDAVVSKFASSDKPALSIMAEEIKSFSYGKEQCIQYCRQLASEPINTPLDKDKLLDIVKLLANRDVYTSSEDEVSTAFNTLLDKRADIVKEFVENPELLYWLSVKKKNTAGITLTQERELRIGKVFRAFYENENVNGDENVINNSVATLRSNADKSFVVGGKQEVKKEEFISAIDELGIKFKGSNDSALQVMSEKIAAEIVPNAASKFRITSWNYEKVAKEFNAKNFNSEKAADGLVWLSDKGKLHLVDFVNQHLRNGNAEKPEISSQNLDKIASCLVKSKDDNFWKEFAGSSTPRMVNYSNNERVHLVASILKNLRTSSTSINDSEVQKRVGLFIERQLGAISEKAQRDALFPILFNQENFNYWKNSASAGTVIKPFFNAKLHDSLYKEGRQDDWKAIIQTQELATVISQKGITVNGSDVWDAFADVSGSKYPDLEKCAKNDSVRKLEAYSWNAVRARIDDAYPKPWGLKWLNGLTAFRIAWIHGFLSKELPAPTYRKAVSLELPQSVGSKPAVGMNQGEIAGELARNDRDAGSHYHAVTTVDEDEMVLGGSSVKEQDPPSPVKEKQKSAGWGRKPVIQEGGDAPQVGGMSRR